MNWHYLLERVSMGNVKVTQVRAEHHVQISAPISWWGELVRCGVRWGSGVDLGVATQTSDP
jgi:hypothetical protein